MCGLIVLKTLFPQILYLVNHGTNFQLFYRYSVLYTRFWFNIQQSSLQFIGNIISFQISDSYFDTLQCFISFMRVILSNYCI